MNSLAILGIAVAVAAPLPKERVKSTSSIVGEWVMEQVTVGGADVTEVVGDEWWVFSEEGTYTVYRGTGKEFDGPRYVTDQKSVPTTIDADVPQGREHIRRRGIFKIEGDVMTVCWASEDGSRPTAFESKKGSPTTLYVFKKVKKE
jgi:uncharacterized protein (TIGR03067 family)